MCRECKCASGVRLKKAMKPTAHFPVNQDNLDAKEIVRLVTHVYAVFQLHTWFVSRFKLFRACLRSKIGFPARLQAPVARSFVFLRERL